MSNPVVHHLLALIEGLEVSDKLVLLSGLTDSIRSAVMEAGSSDALSVGERKRSLAHELYGAWGQVNVDSLVDDIYAGRALPDREVSFD